MRVSECSVCDPPGLGATTAGPRPARYVAEVAPNSIRCCKQRQGSVVPRSAPGQARNAAASALVHAATILLAFCAAVIASQAVISDTYSMMRQAIQLGFLSPTASSSSRQAMLGSLHAGSGPVGLHERNLVLTVAFRDEAAVLMRSD